MAFMKVVCALVASLALFLPATALAEPGGRNNYINLHGQTLSLSGGMSVLGLAVDWGAFQSRFVAAGTRLGFSRITYGASTPSSMLELGGGPQFHIPLGDRVLLIPSVNLGYRLSTSYTGMGINAGVALAYRVDSFYLGAEFDAPVWLQGAPTFLPGPNTLNALIGIYY